MPDDSYAKIYTYKDEGEEILLKKVQLPTPWKHIREKTYSPTPF
jgi:hypothetical protein